MTFDDWLVQHADDRRRAGLTRHLRPRAASGPAIIDLAGNDYLGLSRHPQVTAAAAAAALTWGAGAGASRLVTGTLELHAELERSVADFTGQDAGLAFSTGYQANLGAVSALADDDTLLVSDAHVHASLIDACRLSRRGALTITPHNDLEAVEVALRSRHQGRAVVLVESVYSVLGDTAPLVELMGLIETYDAILVVDEAHGVGIAGKDGHGLVHAHGLAGRTDVVTTLTLSKAFGSQGGLVLGSAGVIEHLVNTARPFIYDTGLAPPAAGAALAALKVLRSEPGLSHRTVANAARLAAAAGLEAPPAAVLSMPMPGPEAAVAAQRDLFAKGVQVGCFRPPSVPGGISRLRVTARADLTESELDLACDLLATVREQT